jgi:L-asparagine permease
VISGVVFAYAAVELVGTAAGETENPEKIMPRAINSVAARIALFYVGSLVLLLPYTLYSKTESPFVTFFAHIGISGSGTVMNLVVLTAALSSLNAGLYSTGRILRSMAMNGSAPEFTSRMTGNGVPWGGIVLTSFITLLGVGLNALNPGEAFEIVLSMSALGILASWGTIVLCHLRLFSWWREGIVRRPHFRMPGAPWSGWLTMAFLFAVLVLMGFDYPVGTYTLATLVVIIPALIVGWYLCRDRVRAAALARGEITGRYPVVAERPERDEDD